MHAAPGEVWVNGDRTRLAQVIGNLLQNAVKFTPRGGGTSVSVEGDTTRREAIVRVQDTGRGIAPEVLPCVFEPFTQADTTLDRQKGGLGLGLAVAKGVVELHGGSIGAESAGLDQGVTFTIVLPLEAAGPAERQEPRGGAVTPPRRVLVIEDNDDAAVSLREVLELEGHQVEVASSGPEGLEKARGFKPDLVICDIGLPGMDGYAVARAMRADPELGGIALVALTGYAAPNDEARAREAGFRAHLAKPASLEALRRILADASGG
jgi:two-component system CheB/CheR fusion protein